MKTITIGICSKCGKEKQVREHHYKGYGTDETKPYCLSCDFKAHNKARREGRCVLKRIDAQRLSQNSYNRRNRRIICVGHETVMPNVQLSELISYNTNTGKPSYEARFHTLHGVKLKYIEET